MKPRFIYCALMVVVGAVRLPAADSVEVNGIARLGREKLACLLVYQPARPRPLNFTLAEGESRYGFTVLAVDATGGQVLIEKCGVKKYFRLNAAPEVLATTQPPADSALSTGMSPNPVTAPERDSIANYLVSDDSVRILAGNPSLVGTSAAAAKNFNSGQSTAPSPSNPALDASNGGAGAGSQNLVANAATGTPEATVRSGGNEATLPAAATITASQSNDLASQLWYQESLSMEQSRVLTAADVLSGKMEPFGRTPLTPAGTPSALVGQEVYFSDQIPGFKVTGYLDQ